MNKELFNHITHLCKSVNKTELAISREKEGKLHRERATYALEIKTLRPMYIVDR